MTRSQRLMRGAFGAAAELAVVREGVKAMAHVMGQQPTALMAAVGFGVLVAAANLVGTNPLMAAHSLPQNPVAKLTATQHTAPR